MDSLTPLIMGKLIELLHLNNSCLIPICLIMKFQQQQECLSIHLQATAHFLNILNLQKLQSSLSHSLMEFKFIETKEVQKVMWLS